MAVDSRAGMNVNYNGPGSNLPNDIPEVAELGFGTIRLLICGYYSQSTINTWNAVLEVARAQSRFKRIIIGVGPGNNTMTWGNWSGFSSVVMSQAAYLAGLNDSRIEYQIGNEMELHHDASLTNAQVRIRLRADAAAVKAAYPSLKLSYASSVSAGNEVVLWAQEGRGSFDRLGFNVYGPRASFRSRIHQIATLLPGVGYVSEWGTSNGYSDFEDETLYKFEVAARQNIIHSYNIDHVYYAFREHENKWGAKTTDGHVREIWPLLIGSSGISMAETPSNESKLIYKIDSTNPTRTDVHAPNGFKLATFTNGSRTVTVRRPNGLRTFTDGSSSVQHLTWVRLLPEPFNGTVPEAWLMEALLDVSPDVLEIACQYILGAPPIVENGLQIAGDASYGPLQPDGSRAAGSDFNDYLGISWQYGASSDNPEASEFRCLDCSGFVRMVYGYRCGMPLTLNTFDGVSIPRVSADIAASGPGTVIVPDTGVQVTDFSKLLPGDIVAFDAEPAEPDGEIDHVGIYMGQDFSGNQRFISSRNTANGPMFSDLGGPSILNGNGLYARTFRSVRRL